MIKVHTWKSYKSACLLEVNQNIREWLKLPSKPLTNEPWKPDKLTVEREKSDKDVHSPSKEDVSEKGWREIFRKTDAVFGHACERWLMTL